MEKDMTLNLNQAECLKEQYNIGETVYHNVCSGIHSTVPWGTLEVLTDVFRCKTHPSTSVA